MEPVLYISSAQEAHCGVYQFGKNVAAALARSARFKFIPVECDDSAALFDAIVRHKPAAIVYNYHPGTLPWVTSAVTHQIHVPQIGTIHECHQAAADAATNQLFDAHVAPDPTLLLKNPLVFKTGRLVPQYVNSNPMSEIPTIGSFGFGLEGKGFERIIETVQREFEHARIRLHIPFSPIIDPDATLATKIRRHCEELVTKPGIELVITHEFLDQNQLLDFLAGNSVNVFLYDPYPNRGLSSSTDYALAVGRPLALSRSEMFRHLRSAQPPIDVDSRSLRQIIEQGVAPLEPFRREWTEENLAWDYEYCVAKLLTKPPKAPWHRHPTLARVRSAMKKISSRLSPPPVSASANWVYASGMDSTLSFPNTEVETYRGLVSCEGSPLNRILDNEARVQYRSAIDELFRLEPEMVARKMPEANIQQAFVLDAVHKLAKGAAAPKILCVGSYEDSAFACLQQIGHRIEQIDPVLNFSLSDFVTRPSTAEGSYDIIFSTSVIEHVEDDEGFLKDIASLLSPGGLAVLTCDYQDAYRPGDPKPDCDFRFYTQRDFRDRLMPLLTDCELVDVPHWNCPEPDFQNQQFRYTFATLVFRKKPAAVL